MPSFYDMFDDYDIWYFNQIKKLSPEKKKEFFRISNQMSESLFRSEPSKPSKPSCISSGSSTCNVVINGSAMIYTGSSGSASICAPNVGTFSG